MPEEVAIEGWAAIAKIFGCSLRKMKNYREELMNGGFIFYKRTGRGTVTVCAFPSSLRIWASYKGKKREVI